MPITFTLPSNPAKEIRLHEASVADAMEFTEIDPTYEEEAVTLFLNKVQDQETYQNSREWTGEDRRFALFTYYINTTNNESIILTFTYDGLEQSQEVPVSKILSTYTPLEGAAERDFAFNAKRIVVAPLKGADLERLEVKQAEIDLMESEYERLKGSGSTLDVLSKLSKTIRKKKAKYFLSRVCAHIDVPSLQEDGTKDTRRGAVEQFVTELTTQDFTDLFERVGKALEEMHHGLMSSYKNGRFVLLIPGIIPDNADGEVIKDGGLTLSYPFQFSAVIPSVF